MAEHIASIASSTIPKVSKEGFYAALQFGDHVLCEGNYAISKAIERATNSCLSHILTPWLPANASQWLTAESTKDKGVHVGRLVDYVDEYNGDLVLVRSALTEEDRFRMMNNFYSVLEDAYNASEEIATVGHKLVKFIKVEQPRGEYYCSQLVKFMRSNTTLPFGQGLDGANFTPEDAWLEPSVVAVCAYVKTV